MDTNTQLQLILDEIKKLNERVSQLESPKIQLEMGNETKTKKLSLKEFLLKLKPSDDASAAKNIG